MSGPLHTQLERGRAAEVITPTKGQFYMTIFDILAILLMVTVTAIPIILAGGMLAGVVVKFLRREK